MVGLDILLAKPQAHLSAITAHERGRGRRRRRGRGAQRRSGQDQQVQPPASARVDITRRAQAQGGQSASIPAAKLVADSILPTEGEGGARRPEHGTRTGRRGGQGAVRLPTDQTLSLSLQRGRY